MTDNELIVLGLLAERERYPYEVEEEIKARRLRTWARIGFSSIYRALRSLEKKGLVTSWKTDSPLGPDRRIHTITDKGIRELRSHAVARLAERFPLPVSFWVGLSLIPHLEHNDVVDALRRHLEQIRACRDEMEQSGEGESRAALAMHSLDRALTRAEEAWLAGFVEEMEKVPDHE